MTTPLLARMDPTTLRDLGHALIARAEAAEQADPRRKAYRNLTPEGIERLAEILASGSRPTVGFFLRLLGERPGVVGVRVSDRAALSGSERQRIDEAMER